MRAVFATILLCVVVSSSSFAGKQSEEAVETRLDLEVMETLLHAQVRIWEESGGEGSAPKNPITVREYSKQLSKEVARRMIRRDGWGNDFRVAGGDNGLMILSVGQDGFSNILRHFRDGTEPDEGERLEDLLGDDIALIVGEGIISGPTTVRERQKRTMADLRSIGTSIESYSIDNNVYPRQDTDLLPVELIRDLLTPVYIRTLPLVDAWGNEFLMWGTDGEYVVMSLGADGAPDRYYDFGAQGLDPYPFGGGFTDPNDDIVFANGQFVQWPERTQR